MTFLEKIVTYVIGIPIIILFGIYEAWIFTLLWAWFIIPVFHLPALTTVKSFCLLLVASLAVHPSFSAMDVVNVMGDEDQKKRMVFTIMKSLVFYPTLALLIGYVIKSFFPF
jgi:hypothetical protein